MNKTLLLFLIILIEGYVVLASELLAIRQLIPFVGSGPEIISIVISAVLLPLAVGYYKGGQSYRNKYARTKAAGQKSSSARTILLWNVLVALAFLAFGLCYGFLNVFFHFLGAIGIKHRLVQTAVFSLLFLVTPIFLLGQTLPLVSNYFSAKKLSEITGKMLFFSTTGSFLGSVFSTIVLMSTIGVHNTVIFTLGLLCFLTFLLEKKRIFEVRILGLLIMSIVGLSNNDVIMSKAHFVSDNAYNMIRVVPEKDRIVMAVNAGGNNLGVSAILSKDPEKGIPVINYIQSTFIDPLNEAAATGMGARTPPRNILIVGAGGFVLGLNDAYNRYTYVDIDRDIKNVAENEFLHEKLTPNKKFVAISARAFLHNNVDKYDFIVIDVYTNTYSVAMETTTKEFMEEVKGALNVGGIVVANVYSSPNYQDKFSIRYNNTFASMFPGYNRQIISRYNPWKTGVGTQYASVLYVYFDAPHAEDKNFYTDDKNTYSLDLGN